jgi:uncharacterized DUF497 family protein
MAFIFDADKSALNREKHGIDFREAQALWLDERLVRFAAKDGAGEEKRYLFIGMIGVRHWSAIVTYRGEDIRIISVRRARDKEIEAYEDDRY